MGISKEEIYLKQIAAESSAAMSPNATIMFGDTEQNEYVGPFYALTALAEAVIDVSQCTLGIKTRTGASTMGVNTTNVTIPAGVTIYGTFSSVELDSGTVLAYSKPQTTVTVAT
tara:strand:- start:5690 stop:6031 length:342 start_codon:yes stop_codon:yes gene_type:complete